MNIPEKDINLIRDVADYVARTNPVKTYTEEDLGQEMFIYGMESYSKWDESKHSHKNESKRDKNLRLFLKDYMIKRVKNMYKSINRNKRAVNVNVVSFDQNDPIYESMLLDRGSKEISEKDFEGLGLDDEEIKVLMYIANNGLRKNGPGKNDATKTDISNELGIEYNKLNKILGNLKDNIYLKEYLEGKIQPI